MNTAERASNFLVLSNGDLAMRSEFGAVYDDLIIRYFEHKNLGHFIFFKDESLLVVFHSGSNLELLATTKEEAAYDLLDWGAKSGRLHELALGLKQALEVLESSG